MRHWSSKYLGKPYIENKYDCLDFVLEVLSKEYGIDTGLISNHGTCTAAQQKQLQTRLSDYSETITEPVDGCVVMMLLGKRLQHLGVYYKRGGKGYIIHNSLAIKAVIQTIDNRISAHGFTVDRYLKWSKK